MSIVAIVEALVGAEATPQMILAAVTAFEKQRESKENDRRHRDAERKRMSRMSHGHPVTSEMSKDTPPNSSNGFSNSSLTSFTPTKENPPKGGQKKSPQPEAQIFSLQTAKPKSIRGTRLHIDWDLPKDWGEWAESLGMSREHVIRECDKFKDFWISKSGANATKMHWEATWRNWIRRHLEDYAK